MFHLAVSTIETSSKTDDSLLPRGGFPMSKQSASIRRADTQRSSVMVSSQSMSMSVVNASDVGMLLPFAVDTASLPEHFNPKEIKFHELDSCEICEQVFNMTNRRHHCRRCGKSVCTKCGSNMKALSRSDQKTLYKICDACDTDLENFKLKKNHDEIIVAQRDQIEVLKVAIESAEARKSILKEQYDKQKAELQAELERKLRKKEEMDRDVDQLRRELERLNGKRNNLYAVIGNEERELRDKEQEKNKLIAQKSLKLTDLAEKEKQLHEKEQRNEELRRMVEA